MNQLAATLAVVASSLLCGLLNLAYARHARRQSVGVTMWVERVQRAAAKDIVIRERPEETPQVAAAITALRRLQPWETASRALVAVSLLWLLVATFA